MLQEKGVSQGPTLDQLARAVALCYEKRENDEQIAERLGVTRRTLARWKHHPMWGPMRLAASHLFRLQLERESAARMAARYGVSQ